jgi:hypothetical protein
MALKASARKESDRLCCDPVGEALKDGRLVSRCGLTVATDLIIAHKRDGDKLLARKTFHTDNIWAGTVKQELVAFGASANQPQDGQEELHMLHVKDQIALLTSRELHLVHEAAGEIDDRSEREFPQ